MNTIRKGRKGIETDCVICGATFLKERHLIKKYKSYCSEECLKIGRKNGKLVKCLGCGKEVYKTNYQLDKHGSGRYFCSRSCAATINNGIYRTGEAHPNYIDGSSYYRKRTLKHSKHECVRCGYNKHIQVLEVHHIDRDRSNNDDTNLEVLCRNCHAEEHLVNNFIYC